MEQVIHTLSTGDAVVFQPSLKSIFVRFQAPRKVLSTSLLNGAYREDLVGVFNHNCGDDKTGHCDLKASTYQEHLRVLAGELGFNPDHATGMGTAAEMENAVVVVQSYRELTVTAIVTGGVEGNGGRAGDPATYYAPQQKLANHKPGTINIILVLDTDLPAGILARALVTCTEAKTAALQELMAGSLYSNGLATGSGTDQTIVIANPQSPLYFEGAGKHSKLGELIGVVVKEAVKEALYKQSGLSPAMQYSMLRRWQRYGIHTESLWQAYTKDHSRSQLEKHEFEAALASLDKESRVVAISSLYIHLLDQFNWGLLPLADVKQELQMLITQAYRRFHLAESLVVGETLEDFVAVWKNFMLDWVANQTAI